MKRVSCGEERERTPATRFFFFLEGQSESKYTRCHLNDLSGL